MKKFNLSNIIFLSTPSVWRATDVRGLVEALLIISIHALRVEGDASPAHDPASFMISIHALRVEGDLAASSVGTSSTLISIHALRVEGDVKIT